MASLKLYQIYMIEKNVVKDLVERWLEDKEYFLTDLTVSADNRIVVEIDHEEGVWIEDCVELSRFIEEGLDRDAEIKQLEVMRDINANPDRKVDIATTFLGAHALPPEYKGRHEEFIDFIIDEMLPLVKERNLAENCDIFCEKGVFTV